MTLKRRLVLGFTLMFCVFMVNCNTKSPGQNASPSIPAGYGDASIAAEAVDLGLSVKWASFNVGAAKPEDYGTYFGWGDVTGVKTSRNNDDYPNANPPENICGTEYDAAHILWGGSWRMPDKEEAEELVNNCVWQETALNGVAGFRVTGKNGNSIFLAAGGGRDGTSINYSVVGADFWTGTISDTNGEAWCFTFYQGRHHVDDLWRHYGFAIRPVCN